MLLFIWKKVVWILEQKHLLICRHLALEDMFCDVDIILEIQLDIIFFTQIKDIAL